MPWRYWLKWVGVVETKHQLLLAQIAKRGPYNDCALLRPLVDIAREVMPAACVLADAEFDSERNHRRIREVHQMKSVIPAKRGKKTWRLKGTRASMRANFPVQEYRERNLIETIFFRCETETLGTCSWSFLILTGHSSFGARVDLQPISTLKETQIIR